jgi:hypothetical protein
MQHHNNTIVLAVFFLIALRIYDRNGLSETLNKKFGLPKYGNSIYDVINEGLKHVGYVVVILDPIQEPPHNEAHLILHSAHFRLLQVGSMKPSHLQPIGNLIELIQKARG